MGLPLHTEGKGISYVFLVSKKIRKATLKILFQYRKVKENVSEVNLSVQITSVTM